jgi:hypothetical protein
MGIFTAIGVGVIGLAAYLYRYELKDLFYKVKDKVKEELDTY